MGYNSIYAGYGCGSSYFRMLADKFGYKRLYFIGLLLFTFGSMLCGRSSDENMLIVSRVIQGLGAGQYNHLAWPLFQGNFHLTSAVLHLDFGVFLLQPLSHLDHLLAVFLIDRFSWPLIFDVNIPVGLLAMLFTIIIQSEYINRKARKFDIAGFISVTIFLRSRCIYCLREMQLQTHQDGMRLI